MIVTLSKPLPCLALVAVFGFSASAASAEIQGGIGASYADLGSSDSGTIDVWAADLSVGWRFAINEALSIAPEARFLIGVQDWSEGPVTAELKGSYGAVVRFQYDFVGGLYFFAAPAYTSYKLGASVDFGPGAIGSASDSEWLFSGSTGLGINFTENWAAEIRYEQTEKVEGDDLVFYGIGLRYRF
jgi:hypothetical protein